MLRVTGHNRIGQAEFCYIIAVIHIREAKWKTRDL